MSVISKFNYYGEDKRDWEGKTISNINYKGEDYHFAERNQVDDGTCINAVEEPIYDMQISGNSVQDGNPTTETPIEVVSVGNKTANILNNEEITYAYNAENVIINRDGFSFTNINTQNSSYIYDFKYLNIGTYTISGSVSLSDGLTGGWAIYDEQNSVYLVNNSSSGKIEGSFEITEARRYRICFYCNYNSPSETVCTYTNIMLVKDATVTEYEPYGYKLPIKVQDTIHDIYLKEPLRQINGIADYLDYKNKKVVRNIKAFELKGTEAYGLGSTNDSSKKRIYITTTGTKKVEYNILSVLCTHYKAIIPVDTYNCIQGCSGYDNDNVSVVFDEAHQTVESFNAFTLQQYNSGTPVIIYGTLLTPIEESVELPEISTVKGTNIVDVQTEIQPTALSVEYWKQI